MSDLHQNNVYTKARFFKCALQVNPASYNKYRGQPQALSEDQYNQQLLEAALETGLINGEKIRLYFMRGKPRRM